MLWRNLNLSIQPALHTYSSPLLRKFLGLYHEKWTTYWYTVISLLLKPLKQRFINVTSFRLS
jgi:hypothetical protein